MAAMERFRQEDGMMVRDGISVPIGTMRPPWIKLGQNTGEGSPGKIIRSDTNEEFDFMDITPIAVQGTRAWRGVDNKDRVLPFDRERPDACQSRDGVKADDTRFDGTPTAFPGRKCWECPRHDKGKPELNTAYKGFCSPNFVVMVRDESGEIFGLRLRGTSAYVSSMFITEHIFQKTLVRLSGVHVVTSSNDYYKLDAKPERVLDKGEQEMCRADGSAFKTYAVTSEDSDRPTTNATVVDNSPKDTAPSVQSETEWRRMRQGSKERLDAENAEQAEMKLEEEDVVTASEGESKPPW